MSNQAKHINITPYPVNDHVAKPFLSKIRHTDHFSKEEFLNQVHEFFNQQDIEGPSDDEIMKVVEYELTKTDYTKFSGYELTRVINMFCTFIKPGKKEMKQSESKMN